MPRPIEFDFLGRGAQAWNAWREQNPTLVPDLTQLDLSEAVLSRYDLSRVNLRQARLRKSHLSGASRHHANLAGADLFSAPCVMGQFALVPEPQPRYHSTLEQLIAPRGHETIPVPSKEERACTPTRRLQRRSGAIAVERPQRPASRAHGGPSSSPGTLHTRLARAGATGERAVSWAGTPRTGSS